MKTEKLVFGSFDLGFGLHIALDPEHYEALIPNIFVVNNSLGKLYPQNSKNWDLDWTYCKKRGHAMVDALNSGTITQEQVIAEIKEINEGFKNNEIAV